MNRLLILMLLVVVACFAGWYWVQQDHERVFQIEMGKALAAHASKNDREAEETLKALLPDAEKWWPKGPHLVENLSWLGVVYRVELKYDLAEPVLKRAVDLSEQEGTTSTIALGRAKLSLGIIARDESDDVEAQRLFTEAAGILTKDPQTAWGDDAAALLNLGFLADKQGRYQEAQSYLIRAVSGYETLFRGTPEPDLANAHFHLAEVYRHLDQFAEAAEQYQSALKLYEQIEGPRGRNVRNAAMGVAIVKRGEGGSAQASSLMQRALDSSSNPADLDGATLNNLANLARDKKQYTEAESLYKKACAAYEKSGGPNDAGLATAFANLGKLYRDESQFDISKAELPLKRALAIRENVLGAEHPDTAKTLSDLSLLYFHEKKPAEAEEFARRALPLEEKTFGSESLQVSTTLNRLGISERDQGKFKEAEVNLKRALTIRETKQAPESWIAISLENLASVYEREGLEAKATPLITRARALHSRSSNN